LILRAGKKYGLDPYLIAALMQTESAGDPRALSPMNAVGLLQVLNGPADPETNIDQGAAMLASHVKRFGNASLALAAYNAGPNAVAQYGGIPPYEETYNHVTRTLASYAAYRGG
jgi:soluble lytic murein transglycosylase-like protein